MFRLFTQRAEEEKLRQEELRKQEAELAEKLSKEDEERDARKKVSCPAAGLDLVTRPECKH